MTQFIRTKYGCYTLAENFFGSHPIKIEDPEADETISFDDLRQFKLGTFSKIPADLWTAWVKLCFHFVEAGCNTEVSCRLMHDEAGNWRILIPRQEVGGASVRVKTFDESVDIITGEEHDFYPPEGWRPLGSSHSHNTMGAFFSGTDDHYEIDDPGAHITVGGIKLGTRQYEIAASVTANKTRFKLAYDNLLDATPVEGVNFHPKVLDYITEGRTTATTYHSHIPANTYLGGINTKGKDDAMSDDEAYKMWQREVHGAPYWMRNRGLDQAGLEWQFHDLINQLSDFINYKGDRIDVSPGHIQALLELQSEIEEFIGIQDTCSEVEEIAEPAASSAPAPATATAQPAGVLVPTGFTSRWDDTLSDRIYDL